MPEVLDPTEALNAIGERKIDPLGYVIIPPREIVRLMVKYGRTVECLASETRCDISYLISILTDVIASEHNFNWLCTSAVTDWTWAPPLEVEPKGELYWAHYWSKGGGTRNKLMKTTDTSLLDYYGKPGIVDKYSTVYSYPDEFRDFVETSGSVAKYDGAVKAHTIHIDMDGSSAWDDVRELLSDPSIMVSSRAYFSGSKGFHIMVSHVTDAPGIDIPERVKAAAVSLAGHLKSFDPSPYDRTRLWRIVNTINSGSGLFKIPLLGVDLVGEHALTIEQIRARASKQRSWTDAASEFWGRVHGQKR